MTNRSVTTEMPGHHKAWRSWLVVLSSALFFFFIFIQMNLFNAINPELMKEFHFTGAQLGQIFAWYSIGNIIFLFPAGMLLDRFSVKALLLVVFIVSTAATYLFSWASSFEMLCFARLLIGLAGAFALLTSIKLASRWFEPKHMALVVGVVVTMAMVGGAVAQTPLTILTQKVGWREALHSVTLFGALLIIIQALLVRDDPLGTKSFYIKEHAALEHIGFWRSLGLTLINPQNWLAGLYVSLVNLPLFVFGGMWGSLYLSQVHHLSRVEAANATSMIFVGMMIGSPLAGYISDRLSLRKKPMIIGAVLSLIVMLVVMYAPDMPVWAEVALYFILGLVIGAQVIGYPVIAESNPHSITATATGLGSTLIMGAGLLVPLFGWLLDIGGDMQVIDSVSVYSAADFLRANMMLLASLVIALIAAFLVKETHCKPLIRKN